MRRVRTALGMGIVVVHATCDAGGLCVGGTTRKTLTPVALVWAGWGEEGKMGKGVDGGGRSRDEVVPARASLAFAARLPQLRWGRQNRPRLWVPVGRRIDERRGAVRATLFCVIFGFSDAIF